MKQRVKTLVAACAATILMASTSEAALLNEHVFGRWPDPLTPPHTRTTCTNMREFDLFGNTVKTCFGWRTESRFMFVEGKIRVSGPENIADSVRQTVNDCTKTAGIAAVAVGYVTGSTAGLATAKLAFNACLSAKAIELAEQYDLDVSYDSVRGPWQ